jgi:sentrin-specific protease 8
MSPPKAYKDSDLILNYHDAVLYGSDLKRVQSRTEWLNDACIHFFFNRLQQEHAERNTTTSSSTSSSTTSITTTSRHTSALFMDPAVLSFFMHQCTDDEDVKDFVTNTRFPETSGGTVFLPVNDNMALSSNWKLPKSGSHWSLLVVMVMIQGDEEEKTVEFWHFDSVRNSGNRQAAQDIADKMGQHIFVCPQEDPSSNSSSSTSSSPVIHRSRPSILHAASTPPQSNGYDCGIHVLATAQLFSSMTMTTTTDSRLEAYESKLRNYVHETPDFCQTLRTSIANDILRLAAEKEEQEKSR